MHFDVLSSNVVVSSPSSSTWLRNSANYTFLDSAKIGAAMAPSITGGFANVGFCFGC